MTRRLYREPPLLLAVFGLLFYSCATKPTAPVDGKSETVAEKPETVAPTPSDTVVPAQAPEKVAPDAAAADVLLPPEESEVAISEEPTAPFAESNPAPILPPTIEDAAITEEPAPTIAEVPSAKEETPVMAQPPKESEAPAKGPEEKTAMPKKTPQTTKIPASVLPAETPTKGIASEPVARPATPIPELPARAAPVVAEEKVTYSRTARATVGQLVEIPFRGSGWVFLGEQGSRKGLPYDSRRLDADGQSFIFRAEAPGTYSLKFFRQDFIEDYVINDYVQVIVGEAEAPVSVGGFSTPVDRGRVVAEPRWPPIASQAATTAKATSSGNESSSGTSATTTGAATTTAAAKTGANATPAANAGTATAATSAGTAPAATAGALTDSGVSPEATVTPAITSAKTGPNADGAEALASLGPDSKSENYLSVARAEYEAGRISSALSVLNQFQERYPAGSDEAWWLYGRALEANGPNKDVKSALAYYRRLVAEYPQSSRYNEARKRIAYLERYYFEIR